MDLDLEGLVMYDLRLAVMVLVLEEGATHVLKHVVTDLALVGGAMIDWQNVVMDLDPADVVEVVVVEDLKRMDLYLIIWSIDIEQSLSIFYFYSLAADMVIQDPVGVDVKSFRTILPSAAMVLVLGDVVMIGWQNAVMDPDPAEGAIVMVVFEYTS